LRDAAFRSHAATSKDPVDQHEAFYKAAEAVDLFLEAKRHHDETYSGAGMMELTQGDGLNGFLLSQEGQLVHGAGFGGK